MSLVCMQLELEIMMNKDYLGLRSHDQTEE